MAVGATGCSDDDDPAADATDAAEIVAPDDLPRLHAVRGTQPGVFDDDGRQVLLRAVNLNSLGHYARNNPDLAPTQPLDGHVWDEIAAEGFNAVRLLVSWSRLEPVRGQIDDAYVEEIRQAVQDAANRDLYVVVDMHQDAWGPFVASPPGTVCADGREPANGWDGAPQWATPSPVEFDSCRPTGGEAKPGSDLVVEAWDRFYNDTDGVQSGLVAVWQDLAEALADEPSVAGYDLLNEPGFGRGANGFPGLVTEFAPLGAFYDRAIEAIRDAETAAGIEPRPVFFEPTVLGNPVPADFSDDPGLVYAPHLYGGSIASFLTVDAHWSLAFTQAQTYETSLWAGEYGWWDDPAEQPDLVSRVERFASREDGGPDQGAAAAAAPYVPVGGAWWQWTTGCGDPHAVTSAGVVPRGEHRQYRVVTCPEGSDQGVVPEWRTVLTRPYPRFAPGSLTGVRSDGETRSLDVEAEGADPGSEVVLWVPGPDEPQVGGTGIAGARATRTGLGWLVRAEVCTPDYQVTVSAADQVIPPSC